VSKVPPIRNPQLARVPPTTNKKTEVPSNNQVSNQQIDELNNQVGS